MATIESIERRAAMPRSTCEFRGCKLATNGKNTRFCCAHAFGEPNVCLHPGCEKLRVHESRPNGYCYKHMPNRESYLQQKRKEKAARKEREGRHARRRAWNEVITVRPPVKKV